MSKEVISVYVLDASYEVVGSEPQVIIWGVDENGRRVLLRDKKFRPYFYAVVDSKYLDRLDVIKSSIKRLSRAKSPILSIQEVDKLFIGKPVKALRIETSVPEFVREYRSDVAKIPGVRVVVEADIRFSIRYLIDHDISPCTWHRFKVIEKQKLGEYRVDEELEIVEVLERDDSRILPPKLRTLSFDIEVYNPHGVPKPDRDPIIIISIMNSEGEIIQLQAQDKDDRKLLRDFVDYMNKYDPDIVVGYNSNNFDWPYLVERSRKLGIKLDVSRRKGVEPSKSVYGHVSIPGRLHVDLYDFAEEIAEIKVKSLDEVAEYFGVMKKSERTNVPWYDIYKYWDDERLRPILLRYAKDDVISTHGIAEKILPFAMQLSSITGLPLDQVGSASVGFRLEWFLLRVARARRELVPNRVEKEYESYRGAIVLEPKRGVHEGVAVLDFSAMYPSIMMKYNIGPDTLIVGEECLDCFEAPETNYMFRKDRDSFLKVALITLVSARRQVRDLLKKYSPDTAEYRILDARQRALKVLANACYGYMAWTGARWYCKECAEAVADFGRETIKKAISLAKSLGLEVIYGDTDSLFVKYSKEAVEKLIDAVEKELGLEIKVDKIYQKVFFTEAKKRYIGLTVDGRIDVVGFEAVRGDWAEIAKEIQERVAEIVLKTADYRKAVEFVKNEIEKIRKLVASNAIDINKFVIWKTIAKPLNEYEVEAPHVTAAKHLIKLGYSIEVGDKIGYVIIKGSGKISERARPYIAVDPKDLDIDYYVEHQIIPATLRILEYFGVSEKQLKGIGRSGKTLFEYSKK
uniref:DNA polymerase n=1 Tax=Ignisphaera aggregans TaxID=334771 RepID=A0A7J3Z817_9CREN